MVRAPAILLVANPRNASSRSSSPRVLLRLNTGRECDEDPAGYACPVQYTPQGESQAVPTTRKCIAGVTKLPQSQQDDEGWLVGFSGGVGGFVILLIGAVVLVGVGTLCCWYGCKGQCEPVPDVEADSSFSDDDDRHDRGGGLDAAWTDSEEEEDGIQLRRPRPISPDGQTRA